MVCVSVEISDGLIGRTARGVSAHWHDEALSRVTSQYALYLFLRLGADPPKGMSSDPRPPNGARVEGRLRRAVRALAHLRRPPGSDKKPWKDRA
jgi:hypothetical protein